MSERRESLSDWDGIADWWIDAVRDDPTQSSDTLGVLEDLVGGTGGRTIDLGCGEGQVMRRLGGEIVGTDLSTELLHHAAQVGPVVRACLPDLSWVRPHSFDRAVACGVIDMLEDHVALFRSVAEAVRPGGHLVAVMNHPAATAPHSEPLADPEGQVLWKWGSYLTSGSWTEWAGAHPIRIFHRSLATLLSDAASSGWSLERLIERGPSADAIARFPDLHGQENIPSLIGLRWSRTN
ncbi:class I SAM-dependent DNA methyltransferase [Ilumatobacter nonamiensis]|uniref:class I SAM-dependent DNA methyltransferase n=1 Tax=Ilumatobacter nonamiensis TaxID=467093 RepID=UPI00034A3064|nr:class I SAM-dependent methyltransferase [Ilumatobacter nonamiensis]